MTDGLPAAIRPDFPALERTVQGKPVAFFDGPGGSQVPRQVAAAVADYLTGHNANTHGAFATSYETDAILAGAREAMADFVGGRPDEIVFGANMTTLTFHLSRALGKAWGAGGEVVVTALDHQANVGPWRQMAADAGMTVREDKAASSAAQSSCPVSATNGTNRRATPRSRASASHGATFA